ncbi:MAG: hypothetical protein Metus_0754 [Candidatus Methanosuratincola subterraneus]|uniref:Uncharacterized protein n=1 Tax=Methanosuratincola subterraneus TaxID=2593994 RepID=A0A3S3S8K8_METS7|nr:MAG: hypothetical protein Metus_0754 [Candidatus Methanosuratincola subterraneus]
MRTKKRMNGLRTKKRMNGLRTKTKTSRKKSGDLLPFLFCLGVTKWNSVQNAGNC